MQLVNYVQTISNYVQTSHPVHLTILILLCNINIMNSTLKKIVYIFPQLLLCLLI